MVAGIVTKGRVRLALAARRLAAIARGEKPPTEAGAPLDVASGTKLIRDEPPAQFLWLDRSSHTARIDDEVRKGRITAEEAGLLREWGERGYMIIRGCIDDAAIDAALGDVDRVWSERWRVSVDLLSGSGERTFVDRCPPGARQTPHKLNQLHLKSQEHRFTPELFMAKKGDVLLWQEMLAHGGMPIGNPSQTRRSMACHYFSRECDPSTDGLERHGAAWTTKTPVEDPD